MQVTIRQKGGMEYLYADISVSGIRIRGTIGISLPQKRWDAKHQKVKGGKDIESTLLVRSIRDNILESIRKLQREGRLSKEEVKDALSKIKNGNNQPTTQQIYLMPFVESHILMANNTRKSSTIRQYNVTIGKLKSYQTDKLLKLRFTDINIDFYNNFIGYLKKEHNLSTNTLGTHIKNLKMWMNASKLSGLHEEHQYASGVFKKPTEPADTIFLSEAEIKQMINTIMPYPHLENVRDLFVLACYTGVRIQDYGKLDAFHLINNDTMFKIRTEKTDVEVIIPVHPIIAKRILDKYNGKPKVICNQAFNKYIKEVCRVSKIDEIVKTTKTTGGTKRTLLTSKWKLVSSHCARRSFATNAYLAGLPTLAIMAITGHKTEKVFLKYVRVSMEEHANQSGKHMFFSNVG